MYTSPDYFRSDLPAGRSGAWTLERVDIPARHDYDESSDPRPEAFRFRAGQYTCLRRGPTQFMTDLYDEWWTQRGGIEEAVRRGGEVLVTGLGLGLVAEAILRTPGHSVERITILELSPDVIQLVAPHLDARYPGLIEVIQADAFSWQPSEGRRFTAAWHDIWPDPHGVESEMQSLRERFQPYCDWQGFWPEAYLDALGPRSTTERSQ